MNRENLAVSKISVSKVILGDIENKKQHELNKLLSLLIHCILYEECF
ncbi:MAG: hypothetical protein ROY99_01725 [Ignavibacterium sp.]|nr:hypothetical protein [Ignavibacterium sp.]